MKITVTTARLQEGLKKVSGISDGRSCVPILANVLLEAKKDGTLRLTTSNLEMTLGATVECTVSDEGATTVPMRIFEQAVAVLPAGDVELSVGANEKMTLRTATSRMTIGGMEAKLFPARKKFGEGCVEATIARPELVDALRKTAYAMSRDDVRKTLNSVLFDLKGDVLTTVATDGRRLALARNKLAQAVPEPICFVVPDGAVVALKKFIASGEGDLVLRADATQIEVSTADKGSFMAAKLVDGAYPDYTRVIPAEHAGSPVELDRQAFAAALGRVAIMASSSTPSVNLTFGENLLSLDVSGDDECNAHEKMPIKHEGSVKLALNPKYILDVLNASDADAMRLEFGPGFTGPLTLTAEGEETVAVIMPLRTA